jgi:hypothetical protein
MINRYPGACPYCGGPVAAKAGKLVRVAHGRVWAPAHLACANAGEAEVETFTFLATGESVTRNRRGRCEDAPCCGCCT